MQKSPYKWIEYLVVEGFDFTLKLDLQPKNNA